MSRYNYGAGQSQPYQLPTGAETAGWTYTGQNDQSRVVFAERGGQKMDYYPTTGKILLDAVCPAWHSGALYSRTCSSLLSRTFASLQAR